MRGVVGHGVRKVGAVEPEILRNAGVEALRCHR